MTDIRTLLKNHDLTVGKLAKAVGCTSSHMSEMIGGKKTPSLLTAMKIQKASGGAIPVASFVDPKDLKDVVILRPSSSQIATETTKIKRH